MFSSPLLVPSAKRLLIVVSCFPIDHYWSIEPLVSHLLSPWEKCILFQLMRSPVRVYPYTLCRSLFPVRFCPWIIHVWCNSVMMSARCGSSWFQLSEKLSPVCVFYQWQCSDELETPGYSAVLCSCTVFPFNMFGFFFPCFPPVRLSLYFCSCILIFAAPPPVR